MTRLVEGAADCHSRHLGACPTYDEYATKPDSNLIQGLRESRISILPLNPYYSLSVR